MMIISCFFFFVLLFSFFCVLVDMGVYTLSEAIELVWTNGVWETRMEV
jgi:hypothetical protein